MRRVEFQMFRPAGAQPGSDTVVTFIAHPDDEHLIGTGVFDRFRRAGYNLVIASATAGERGKLWGASAPPSKVRAIRMPEFEASARALGAEGHFLTPRFRDGTLSENQEALNHAALRFVRQWNTAWVYSFAMGPNFPYRFAHLDHDAVAIAAAYASQNADVAGIIDDSTHPLLRRRPHLLGWTVNPYLGEERQYAHVRLSQRARNIRNMLLARHHGSQFEGREVRTWREYFDDITRDGQTGDHAQLLFITR